MLANRVRKTRAPAFLLAALLAWLTPSLVNAAIVHEGTFTAFEPNAVPEPDTVVVNNVTAGTDQLYLVSVVYYKNNQSVSSVSGGSGLTWTLQRDQCTARLSQPGLEIWQAFGSPGATFNVTVTMTGGVDVLSAAVSRYSGADTTTPTEGAAGSNTKGQNGACDTTGVDNAAASLSLTSSQNDSVLYAATHPRNDQIENSPAGDDPDYTERAFIDNSNGGDGANLHVHDRTLATFGADSVDHTLGDLKDWEMAGLVINPAGAGGSCVAGPTVYSTAQAATTYVVPTDCTSVTVKAWGAGGAGGGNGNSGTGATGGGGGFAKADITVTPGESLTIVIGGGGNGGTTNGGGGGGGNGVTAAGGGAGGARGDSDAGGGGGGGGYAAVKRSATFLIQAGGGGGGAGAGKSGATGAGGAGGGSSGVAGTSASGGGGGAGTASAGGALGSGGSGGSAGSANTGGAGRSNSGNAYGGGGGGGGGRENAGLVRPCRRPLKCPPRSA